MTPEENLARRVVTKHGLTPPVDIFSLVKHYATYEICGFPVSIDGVSLWLKVKGRKPHILVSNTLSKRRLRFTMAHELGHVIIPWHLGSIVDETDLASSSERSDYWDLEGEANRFASELLVPSEWTQNLLTVSKNVAAATQSVTEGTQVSIQAATIKIIQNLPPGYVFARIKDDEVTWSANSKGTLANRVPYGRVSHASLFPDADAHDWTKGSDGDYHWWRLNDTKPVSALSAGDDWRALLDLIVADVAPINESKTRLSINGIIAAANGSVRYDRSIERVHAVCYHRLTNRDGDSDDVMLIIQHPLFGRFLTARVQAFFKV